jgi:hypothetical protein
MSDEKKPTIQDGIDAIWEAGGKGWDNIEDPEKFLREEVRGEGYPEPGEWIDQELLRLRAAIVEHHRQRADDRCIEDDDRLYAAAGLPPCDRRVGDKAAMLANCARFIERRCEGGGWPTYAELEKRIADLEAAIAAAGFGIMQTSAGLSIHDVSERAKADDEKTAALIVRNIDLEAALRPLADYCDAVEKYMPGVRDQQHIGLIKGLLMSHARRARALTSDNDAHRLP